jgi:hypothetical protein
MDIANFIETLDNNTNETLRVANGCSMIELASKKDEGWTIIEVLEHIFKTESITLYFLSKPTDKIAGTAELLGEKKLKYDLVEQRKAFKLMSPDILKPKGDIPDIKMFEKMFLDQRNFLKEHLRSGKLVIDNRIHNHPFIGEMTISDWLYFLIHHTQRHLEQIEEIRSMA